VAVAKIKHSNDGECQKCAEIIDRFPGINVALRDWFEVLQRLHPHFHVSCAGRGFEAQQMAKKTGASRANYGESAHNYNCALDLFIQLPNVDLYNSRIFNDTLLGKLPPFLVWYGEPGSKFKELPHVEVRAWKNLLASGFVKIVERDPREVA